MAMRKKYWAVCYANVCRWAGPCLAAAALLAQVITYITGGR